MNYWRNGMRKLFFFIIGVLLLPVCWGISLTFFRIIGLLGEMNNSLLSPFGWFALSGGFLLWQIVFFVLPKPVRFYVLGHELTHAFWGLLMGAEVKNIKVAQNKGSVSLSYINFFVTLAPYFFPFYTFLVLAGYYLLSVFFEVEKWHALWLFMIGFTWGFHFNFTIMSLLQRQSDIILYGRLFSYAVIYAMNICGICLWIIMVTPIDLQTGIEYIGKDVPATFLAAYELLKPKMEMLIKLWQRK